METSSLKKLESMWREHTDPHKLNLHLDNRDPTHLRIIESSYDSVHSYSLKGF